MGVEVDFKNIRLFGLLLVLAAPLAKAEEPDPDAPTVGASLDRSEVQLGDPVTLTVSAVAKNGVALSLPAKLELGKFEIIGRSDGDSGGRDLGDGRRSHRFVLHIAGYELGEQEIPPVTLSYSKPGSEVRTVETSAIPIKVKGLIPQQEPDPQLQQLRATRSAMVKDERWLKALRLGGVIGGGALVLLAAFLVIRRFSRRAEALAELSVPVRPADELAMERLRVLRERGNFSVDGYRPFYFEAAEILRAYLGGRYGFDSLELTSTELLDALRAHASQMSPESRIHIEGFIADTDLVKFAKTGSTDQAALAVLDSAQAIILATTPTVEAPVVAATEDAPAEIKDAS
jgi:hypothetical protein